MDLTGLLCESNLRRGKVFAFVGLSKHLEDLQGLLDLKVTPFGGGWFAGLKCLRSRETGVVRTLKYEYL